MIHIDFFAMKAEKNLDFPTKCHKKQFFQGEKGKFNFTCSSSSYEDLFCEETLRNFAAKHHKISHCSLLFHTVSPRIRGIYHLSFYHRSEEYIVVFSLPALYTQTGFHKTFCSSFTSWQWHQGS